MKNSYSIKKAGILIFACLFVLIGCPAQDNSSFIHKNSDGGYTFLVKGKPFLIKGVSYNPAPIGEGYDYDFSSDENKPWMVDGKLMKEMGVNCVRLYSSGQDIEKIRSFIRDMYENFGIYTIIGDWLGLWGQPGPNYANAQFKADNKERILSVVTALKDEEGLLMWVLGNENNYTCAGNITFWTCKEVEDMDDPAAKVARRAELYYSFVDELAVEIKKIDPMHVVALGNGESTLLDIANKVCQNIDALAIIVYRGKKFGNFFEGVRRIFDKPILISEFGADSYNSYKKKVDEDMQDIFIESQWEDLYKNTTISGNKEGNCVGGIVFEWTDEWWKHNEGYTPEWNKHNKEAGWSNGSYYFDIKADNNLNMNEEWFGIVGLSEEKVDNINKRLPKKAYYTLQKFWKE